MAATKKSTASKSKSKKKAAKKSAPKKATGAKKASTGSRSSTSKRSTSKSSAAKKSASKSATAKKSTAKKATAKKATAKKSAAKSPAKKPAVKKTTSARSGAVRKTATAKSASRRNAITKAASKKTTAGKSSTKKTTKKSTQSRKQTGNVKSTVSSMMDRVTGLFGGSETNVIELLKADHDKVEELFEKVKANEDGDNKATFGKIKQELDTHTHIEETIFYPYLLEHGDEELEKIVREGIEEHRQAKMFLVEMDSLSGGSDDFKAKMKVLIEDIEHHVKEEENEMFPMVEDQVDKETLQELGARMEDEKTAFQKNPPAEKTPARAAVG